MSKESIEAMQRHYEAWNEGGPERAQAHWAEEFEYHDPPNLPDAKVIRGRERVLAHLLDQTKLAGGMHVDVQELRLSGPEVVVLLRMDLRGAGSGIELPGEPGHVVLVEDGKLSRMRVFLTWDETLKAAGLRE